MERRIAPSARIEEAIGQALLAGISGPGELSQLGRLGTQLILQGAVEDELAAFLGRARYQRTPELTGSRNGNRPAGSRPPRARSRSRCPRSGEAWSASSTRSSPTPGRWSAPGHWKRSSSAPTSEGCPTGISGASRMRPAWAPSAGRSSRPSAASCATATGPSVPAASARSGSRVVR